MPQKYTILFSLALFVGCSQLAHAQAYSIHINLDQHKNDTVLLAHYYNGKIVVNDTLVTDQNGMANIRADGLLPQGIYTLWFNKQKQIDFLVGEGQTLAIQEKNGKATISGASESEKFQAYMDFLGEKKNQAANLQERLSQQSANPDSASILKKQLANLDMEVQKHWQQEAENAAGSFYGKFVASNIRTDINDAEIPAEILANDSLLRAFKYNFNKKHYWDHFDLYDIRMWRTPSIQPKLNEYLTRF